jgi:hypothetical protein
MTYDLPLSQHDILDAIECEKTRDEVFAHRDRWTPRSERGTFFTLGAASYLDAPRQRDLYLQATRAMNTLLDSSFGWLHQRVKEFFEGLLDEPVFFDHRYALPGFHIFVLNGGDRSQDNVAARAHFDLQYMHAIPEQAPQGTLSFTLPIEEPSGGASMEIWHARYEDAVRLGFSALEYASTHDPQSVAYVRGRIVVHDGFILHAVGRAATDAKGFRISLQGHGVRSALGWLL